jgi:phosphate-selective porin OprO and OprP
VFRRLGVLSCAFAAASLLPSMALAQGVVGSGASVIASAAALAQQPPETKIDASRGGITISSGVNSLTIGARVQIRWTLDDRDEGDLDTDGSGEGSTDGPVSQFDVPRLRLSLSGGVWRSWLRYTFQFEFSRTAGEGDSKIKDAAIEIRPTGRNYRFTFGQFKAPFGLQQLTSSGRQQFVDRAITDAKFTPGRDMGAMVAGTVRGRRIGYDAGVFNGSGESLRQANRSHLWVARVFFDPLGPYGLSEGAADAGDDPVLHLGVGARAGEQIRGRTPGGIVEHADNQTAYNGEFAYKSRRFYSTAEYFWMTDEQENPAEGPDVVSTGFHVQAGFMIIPRTTEVAIRYAAVEGDTDASDAGLTELRGVVGYYWQAHNLKLQADVGRIGYGANFAELSSRARQGLPALGPRLVSGTDLTDTQVRVQLQLAF